jgi:hypothetical protein
MRKSIRISIDPKKRFGAMAKPGEIAFGTQTHLITKPKKMPTLEQLILEAQLDAKKAKHKRKIAQKTQKDPIQVRIAQLNHLKAVRALNQLHQTEALTEYNAIQKKYKNMTINDPTQFLYYRNTLGEIAQRVKFIESLLRTNTTQQEKLKTELTQLLRTQEPTKSQNTNKTRTNPKRFNFSQNQKADLDLLLDSFSKEKKEEHALIQILRNLPKNDLRRAEHIIRLKKIITNLKYLNGLLEEASRAEKTPSVRTNRADIYKVKQREKKLKEEYKIILKLLGKTHPQTIEKNIEYLRTKRSRLVKELRLSQSKKEKRIIQQLISSIDTEIKKLAE